jgi:hypothetical protein
MKYRTSATDAVALEHRVRRRWLPDSWGAQDWTKQSLASLASLPHLSGRLVNIIRRLFDVHAMVLRCALHVVLCDVALFVALIGAAASTVHAHFSAILCYTS